MKQDEIIEEIGRLKESTASLQKQLDKPKSSLDRFKEYAGVVSLLLSLATGIFAIYGSFIVEPEKAKGESQAKLHESLAELVTLDQEYLKEIQQGDPNANNGAIESKRNIILQQAEDFASKPGVASAEDQMNLGNEYEFGRRLEPALSHFNAALKLAGKDSLMKASADTQIGKLNFYGISGSTKEEGRHRFEEAERALGKPTTMQSGIALVQSLGIRSWVECSFGDPASGLQARTRAQDELAILARDPAVSPQLIDAYETSLATGLVNTHCFEAAPGAMSTPPTQPPVSSDRIDLSNQMLKLLVARKYAEFEANMTATAQSQIPVNRLQSIWEQISTITGPYSQTLDTKTNLLNNTTYYIVHARCEKRPLNLVLSFDDANRVSFIFLTPLSALTKSEIEHRAVEIATEFFQEKFADVFSEFDANLKSQLTVNQLQSLFTQVSNASGTFGSVIGGVKNSDLDLVDVLCQLQGGKAIVRVAYDYDMKINGFVIMPSK